MLIFFLGCKNDWDEANLDVLNYSSEGFMMTAVMMNKDLQLYFKIYYQIDFFNFFFNKNEIKKANLKSMRSLHIFLFTFGSTTTMANYIFHFIQFLNTKIKCHPVCG